MKSKTNVSQNVKPEQGESVKRRTGKAQNLASEPELSGTHTEPRIDALLELSAEEYQVYNLILAHAWGGQGPR